MRTALILILAIVIAAAVVTGISVLSLFPIVVCE